MKSPQTPPSQAEVELNEENRKLKRRADESYMRKWQLAIITPILAMPLAVSYLHSSHRKEKLQEERERNALLLHVDSLNEINQTQQRVLDALTRPDEVNLPAPISDSSLDSNK